MRADYRVVLDACVLVPMPLADTLLRMAEAPRLYLPKWSQMIMDEVTRNLIAKWDMAPEKAHRREEELRRHFPEAWIEGFEPLMACPGCCGSFPLRVDRHLQPAPLPGCFGAALGDRSRGAVDVLAWPPRPRAIRVTLQRLLRSLSKNIPGFVQYFCEEQGIDLSGEQRRIGLGGGRHFPVDQ